MSDLDFSEIFEKIHAYLSKHDKIREKILPIQRTGIRYCSEIIKSVHRGEFDSIDERIKKVRNILKEIESLISETGVDFSKDYIHILKQEFGEAQLFLGLIRDDRLLTISECNISPLDYAYALSDVIGELRRYTLSLLRINNVSRAEELLKYMQDIYSNLFTLDYPNGLMPGLRKKIDQSRFILLKTEGDITLSIQLDEFKKSLGHK